jgi:hypothetical protein
MPQIQNRRQFVFYSAAFSVSVLTLGACSTLQKVKNVMSEDLTAQNKVDIEKDPVAKASGYIDEIKPGHPKYGLESCLNCKRYTADKQKMSFGHCSIFSPGLVSENGWCAVWKVKS